MEKERQDQNSDVDALLKLVEVINAKGDAGEIEQIMNSPDPRDRE